jgi:hypothetical protein
MPIGKVEAGVKVECETTWWVELESPYRTGGQDTTGDLSWLEFGMVS